MNIFKLTISRILMPEYNFDKRQEQEYPPKEFCKDNCKLGGFESLVEQHKQNKFYLGQTEHGERVYWYKRGLIRRVKCNECPEAEKYFLDKIHKEVMDCLKSFKSP